jgi:hypothetical protein
MRVSLALVIAIGLLVTPARAAAPAPLVWPGLVIGYRNLAGAHGYHAAVQQAVAAWNAVGAGVRFVPAPKGYSAVQIVFSSGRCLSGNAGHAPTGFQRFGARVVVRACPAVVRPLLVAHELGRVLGLGDDDRGCSLMNSKGTSDGVTFALPEHCSRDVPPEWLPRLVDPGSASAVRSLYAAPAAMMHVRLTPGPRPRVDWIEPQHSKASRAVVLRTAVGCPTRADVAGGGSAAVVYAKPAFPGAHFAVDKAALAPGTYCYRAFNVSATGRPVPSGPIIFVLAAAPTAAAAVVSPAVAGTPIQFTDRSTIAGTTIVHWRWDFGEPASDGANVIDTADPTVGLSPAHTYAAPGTYTVTLTVADALGRSATATLAVSVAEGGAG